MLLFNCTHVDERSNNLCLFLVLNTLLLFNFRRILEHMVLYYKYGTLCW